MAARRTSFTKMALRALVLRCPWCGSRRTFLRGWFRRFPRCRTCGVAWHREVGFELGAVTVNTIVSFAAVVVCMVVGFVATAPEIPVVPMMVLVGAVAVMVPVIAYPFSYTLWLAFDLAVHPPEDAELHDMMTAVEAAAEPSVPSRPIHRGWLSPAARAREAEVRATLDFAGATQLDAVDRRLHRLVERNRSIHDLECINLNPASNVMNPRAEAMLAAGLTTRASLGHAGDKYEMGLEAIEEIEVIAAEAAKAVFDARHVEFRMASGAIANLAAFMATCRPGDTIVVPPATIGGHVTHHEAGAAGLYGLRIVECPVDAASFTIDLEALDRLVHEVRPALVTIGTSLNLAPHPVAQIRRIADQVGAKVLFDAAHVCGLIAGGVWPNPLHLGAHLMTMSTYKSLGGPAGGLVFTDADDLAERLDSIAYPGLTANFDVAKTAALAVTMLDWLEFGAPYAQAMVANAAALAAALEAHGLPVHRSAAGATASHQLAIDATEWGGGHAASQQLRRANLLACAIGLPGRVPGAGLRLGTPEITRIGMGADDMAELAALIADGLARPDDLASVAARASQLRRTFASVHFVRT